MVPRLFQPSPVWVYVKGPRAALAELGVELFWFAVVIGALALIGNGVSH
jgi:hypothetical protein